MLLKPRYGFFPIKPKLGILGYEPRQFLDDTGQDAEIEATDFLDSPLHGPAHTVVLNDWFCREFGKNELRIFKRENLSEVAVCSEGVSVWAL